MVTPLMRQLYKWEPPANADQKAIALRKARQIKISSDPNANDEQIVTFDMNFKVTN